MGEPSAAAEARDERREPCAERAFELVVVDVLDLVELLVIRWRRPVERTGLRIPEVDVEKLDLVDQKLDCLARGSDLLALVRRQPRSPGTQDADLLFVKPFRYRDLRSGRIARLDPAPSQ